MVGRTPLLVFVCAEFVVLTSGFSLAQAGDKPDGETAMEDLESARVQMVEKIKSISDFIEREIENENSKKSEAYRRKREVNGVHWGKGKKHRRGRGEENIEEPIEESEAQEESIESPKEDEELEESIELEETEEPEGEEPEGEEPEGEEPEGEEPEGEEPEGEEPIVSSTEDEEQEQPGEIDIGEEEEITIGEPEEEIEANNEETPVSDFKGHPLDNFSTEQITDMMNHMTSLKNSFDLLISAFNDFKDGSPASDGETVDYQPGEEDDIGPLEETEDEALTDTRGGDPYNEESEEQVEEEEGHASGGGPENYESEGGAEPYESEDGAEDGAEPYEPEGGAEDGAEPYEPEGGAEDGAEPYEPEGGAETYESGESDVVEPEVPEVEKEEDMEESEDIEESEDKEDSEDIEESEDKEESEDIEESENMEGSDDNEVKKSEESSDLEEELKAGDEEIEGEVSGEGIAESGEDTGMNEEAGGYMEPTEEEIPEPNLPSMYGKEDKKKKKKHNHHKKAKAYGRRHRRRHRRHRRHRRN